MGRGFLPEFNEGALVVEVASLPGTSIAQGDQLAHMVEQEVMQEPEVVAIGRRTGRAEEDEHVQGVEASEMDMTLDMEAPVRLGKPRRTKEQLLESLRERLGRIPGIQASFGQPIGHRIDHMLSGTRASIAVKLFGADLTVLRDLGQKIEEVMGTVPGVVDLSVERQALVPTVRIEFDRAAIARHGLHIEDVAHAVELATFYAMLFTEKVAPVRVEYCIQLPCALVGAEEALAKTAKLLDVEMHGTHGTRHGHTKDHQIELHGTVECYGGCHRAPMCRVGGTRLGIGMKLSSPDIQRSRRRERRLYRFIKAEVISDKVR